MKLATAERAIDIITPIGAPKTFSAKMNGKTARTLSSSLYKDKVRAVIREIACNAYDAHVVRGKDDVPFEVHLPNALEPYFSVKDNGHGMSFDTMMSVFTTYFDSTKNDSNDQIGGFGLGSKAPLCLVDSFSVTSIYGGVKTSYCVYFNEKDIPELLPMLREPTNEDTGIEIKVDVPEKLFTEFETTAKRVLKYFKTMPIVKGVSNFEIEKRVPIFENEMFSLYEPNTNVDWSSRDRAVALMGCVAYPLDASIFERSEIALLQFNLVCYFDIGEIDVTAGREELSYDDQTKNTVRKRLKDIRVCLVEYFDGLFAECKTEYEARILYGKLHSTGLLQNLYPDGKVSFKGYTINGTHFHFKLKDYPNTSFYSTNEYSETASTKLYLPAEHIKHVDFDADYKNLIIDDCESKLIQSKLKKFSLDRNYARRYGRKIYVIKSTSPEELAKFLDRIAGMKVYYLSELPKSEPVSRDPVSVYIPVDRKGKLTWEKTFADVSAGGLYLPMVTGTIRDEAGEKVPNFTEIHSLASALGMLTNEPIYGVPKTLLSDFVDNESFTNFFVYLRDQFEKKTVSIDWKTSAKLIIAMKAFTDAKPKVKANLDFITNIAKNCDNEHEISKFLQLIEDVTNARRNGGYTALARLIYVNFDAENAELMSETQTLIDAWDSIDQKYSLISMVFNLDDWNRPTGYVKKYQNYISLVDQKCATMNQSEEQETQ